MAYRVQAGCGLQERRGCDVALSHKDEAEHASKARHIGLHIFEGEKMFAVQVTVRPLRWRITALSQ